MRKTTHFNVKKTQSKQIPRLTRRLCLAILCIFSIFPGCSRKFYREAADKEAYAIITETGAKVPEKLGNLSITAPMESRFFDPFNPDLPPQPEDDPTSHEYMKMVDGYSGSAVWDRKYCKTKSIQNDDFIEHLPKNEKGQVLLNHETVLEIGRRNSRNYQKHLETLYLAALAVSNERFEFDLQFWTKANDLSYKVKGSNYSNSITDPTSSSSSASSKLNYDSRFNLEKKLATGGNLVVGMVNNIMWQFSGDYSYLTSSLFDFTLTQPLLRDAGREIALESLTQSERHLLANLRALARYRKTFYANITTGISTSDGVLLAGQSLRAELGSGVSTRVGGLMGLLEDQVRIQNQKQNVAALKRSRDQLRDEFDAGRQSDRLQVDQMETRLYASQSSLLSQITELENKLDDYKILLGLPPSVDVALSDDVLDQFNLITPELSILNNECAEILQELRDMKDTETEALDGVVEKMAPFLPKVKELTQIAATDYAKLLKAVPERTKDLTLLAQRSSVTSGQVEKSAVDPEIFKMRVVEYIGLWEGPEKAKLFAKDFDVQIPASIQGAEKDAGLQMELTRATELFEKFLATYSPDVKRSAPLPSDVKGEIIPLGKPSRLATFDTVKRLSNALFQLSLLQALCRAETVRIPIIELDSGEAYEIARENRLDWKNARAALVDEWREVEIAANGLESNLNLTVDGELVTPDDNSYRFDITQSKFGMKLQWDTPSMRRTERNHYRTVLVHWQQAKRKMSLYEDYVSKDLRTLLRSITQTQLDFEIERAAIRNSISQVDLTQMRLEAPQAPVGGGTSIGATTARDLSDALSDLLEAQNKMLGSWVKYQSARMTLELNLGTMKIDEKGKWIDPGGF